MSEVDETGQEVLSPEECRRLLRQRRPGRVGLVEGGYPLVLPVNYVFDDDAVVFRTAMGTSLARAAAVAAVLAFEIDETDTVYHGGWSVLVRGAAEQVGDPERIEQLRALPVRPWIHRASPVWIRIAAEHVTGRRIPASGPPGGSV